MSRLASRTVRLRHMEMLLLRSAQGLRAVDLATACNVTRRTIYRDLEALADSGVPIWQQGSRFGIVRSQYLATIRLHFHEAIALYIAARLLARHADESNPHIVSGLAKLAAAFPDTLSEYVARTAELVRQRPANPRFVAVLETLSLCWAEQHKARIWYRSPRSGATRPRDISPYLLEPTATGGLYVIGYDDWAQAIRTFKLERVEQAHRLEVLYAIPADFDPRAHLADAWGIMGGGPPTEVSLHFSPDAAPLIRERLWHPSQRLEEQPDGSLRLLVEVAEPLEMRPWIRSWGPDVTVLAPPLLRQQLADDARRTAGLYLYQDSETA